MFQGLATQSENKKQKRKVSLVFYELSLDFKYKITGKKTSSGNATLTINEHMLTELSWAGVSRV